MWRSNENSKFFQFQSSDARRIDWSRSKYFCHATTTTTVMCWKTVSHRFGSHLATNIAASQRNHNHRMHTFTQMHKWRNCKRTDLNRRAAFRRAEQSRAAKLHRISQCNSRAQQLKVADANVTQYVHFWCWAPVAVRDARLWLFDSFDYF